MLLQVQISVTQKRNIAEKLQSENSRVSQCCRQVFNWKGGAAAAGAAGVCEPSKHLKRPCGIELRATFLSSVRRTAEPKPEVLELCGESESDP